MRGLDERLASCRRLGLTVDEDFERGVTRLRRLIWTVLFAMALASTTAAGIAIVRPAELNFWPGPSAQPLKARAPRSPLRRHAHTISSRVNA